MMDRQSAISQFWSQAADEGAKVYLACPEGGTLVGFIGSGMVSSLGGIPLYIEGVKRET